MATFLKYFLSQAKNFVNKYILEGLVTYYDDQDLKNIVDYVQEEVKDFNEP